MIKVLKSLLFLIISFSVLMLDSCSIINIEITNTCIIIDAEGEKEVPYKPKNVALLYPSFGDIWTTCHGKIAIGVEDNIERGYADSSMKVVGAKTGKQIDLESLVASLPDFVILSNEFPNHLEYAKNLKNFGISYAIFSYNTYNDYLHILKQFCIINGCIEQFTNHGDDQLAKINEIISLAKKEEPLKVLLLRATPTTLKTLPKSNFVSEMVTNLNLINLNNAQIADASLSMEYIIDKDPDVILIIPMGDEELVFKYVDYELENSVWSVLSAVKNNRVIKLEKELYHYKPNTRWEEAYQLLFERIFLSIP